MTFYHYTCLHAAAKIRVRGNVLRPMPQLYIPGPPIIWLTDLDFPLRHELGLTRTWLVCDRGEVRFTVHPDAESTVEPWPRYARTHRVPIALRNEFEADRLPAHWYVSTVPLLVHEQEPPP